MSRIEYEDSEFNEIIVYCEDICASDISSLKIFTTQVARAMSGHGGFLNLSTICIKINSTALVTGGGCWWAASHFIMMNGIFRLLGSQLGA